MPEQFSPKYTLREFAYKKQGPTDAASNALMNGVITYLLLSGVSVVPIMAKPGELFSHSVMGSLVGPAVVIAFMISLATTKKTIKKRVTGEVSPPLKAGVSWKGKALKSALIRALLGLLVVYGIGGILIQINPDMAVSRFGAAAMVSLIGGTISFIESTTAVMRTERLGKN